MDIAAKPNPSIASCVLPAPLTKALAFIAKRLPADGWMLVGGTALAGFYAGHRRSDDLDLFVRDDDCLRVAVAAVRSLSETGSVIDEKYLVPSLYKATVALDGHNFTIVVEIDQNLHAIGTSYAAPPFGWIASLESILRMKAATLVSRCSEKDLYDLAWLETELGDITIAKLIECGRSIDAGVSAENALISITGARLTKASCGFASDHGLPPERILEKIEAYRARLVERIVAYAEKNAAEPPIAPLVREIRRLKRRKP